MIFKKGFVLLFSLLLPILVFLFLKFFGKNEYKLDVLITSCDKFIEALPINKNFGDREIKVLDIRISNDQQVVDLNLSKLISYKKIKLITLSNDLRKVNWEYYKVAESLLNEIRLCIENPHYDEPFLLLLDTSNNIRGIYRSLDQKEIERLNVEIDILKLENEN